MNSLPINGLYSNSYQNLLFCPTQHTKYHDCCLCHFFDYSSYGYLDGGVEKQNSKNFGD